MPEKTEVSSQEYDQLEELLKQRDWKQADERTSELMVKAAGTKGYLDSSSLQNFPCTDFREIDRLWVKYSDGRFGFSVQKRIWERVGGKPGEDDGEIYKRYGDLVGWRVNGQWNYINYSDITFSPNAPVNAPEGYLPNCFACENWGKEKYLFSRAETCRV